MKRIVNIICAIDLLFILFLFASSIVGNAILSEILYYLAFIVPTLIGAYFLKRERPYTEEIKSIYLGISGKNIAHAAPLVMPTVAAVMAMSLLTSWLLGLFGMSSQSAIEGGILYAIIIYALLPSLLEEILFRFIPIKLLIPYSKSAAVVISALLFALIHMDLFVIPYALVAGILFALIDLECESVIPSLLIHFVNNLCSVLLTKTDAAAGAVIYASMGVFTLVSLAVIFIKRRSYARLFSPLYEREERKSVGYAPLAVLIISLFIAFTSLFIQ